MAFFTAASKPISSINCRRHWRSTSATRRYHKSRCSPNSSSA
ncbi:hypothetical protein P4114_19165 [Pseudomonas aeruginosa]|nr:hypothetical protein [Pseudomonas aeruginosa]